VAVYFPDLAAVKRQSIMPTADIDDLNTKESGWIVGKAASLQGFIDARLRKRCPVPFDSPVPDAVLNWLGALLDPEMYLKAGVNPSDQQQIRIDERRARAEAALAEAADGNIGKYDLPARQDTTDTAMTEPATLGYAEQSAFTGKHKQSDAVRYNRRYG
jgi:hypothetical protein